MVGTMRPSRNAHPRQEYRANLSPSLQIVSFPDTQLQPGKAIQPDMPTDPTSTATDPSTSLKRLGGRLFRACATTKEDGSTCGQPCLRGEGYCRHHSPNAIKDKQVKEMVSVSVPHLSDLVRLDLKTSRGLDEFRSGLLAHLARKTLDSVTARSMSDLASAIHRDAQDGSATAAFSDLASQIARELSGPPGEGGIPATGGK